MGVQRGVHPDSTTDTRTEMATTGRKKISLPIVDADAVLTGVVLLIIVEQSSDWYSAIDGS
jgi:hypothetical protein